MKEWYCVHPNHHGTHLLRGASNTSARPNSSPLWLVPPNSRQYVAALCSVCRKKMRLASRDEMERAVQTLLTLTASSPPLPPTN